MALPYYLPIESGSIQIQRSRAEPNTSQQNYTWHKKSLLPVLSVEKRTATSFIAELGNAFLVIRLHPGVEDPPRLSILLDSSPQSLLSSYSFLV